MPLVPVEPGTQRISHENVHNFPRLRWRERALSRIVVPQADALYAERASLRSAGESFLCSI